MTKKTSSRRSSESKMRSSMRQGQQKIKLDIKKPTPTSPPLPLPFPPTQKVEQIVAKLVAKPRLARFPNAFIMYRNEYVQYLKSQGFHISMTELSPMISASWKKESEYVKDAYTKLSSEAEKMYVRDTGSTQPQINYKYLPTTQRPTLTTKIDSEIVIPKLDDPRQTQIHDVPNYSDTEIFNMYDRLLFQLSSSNGFSRNYGKEPSVNGEVPPFSIGASELAKYSLDSAKIDGTMTSNNCFTEPANFFEWPNISSSIQEFPNNHLSTVPQDCYSSPTFSPNTTSPLDDLINSGLSLDQQLESMSPCSTSSSPSDTTSFDEFSSLLFSPDLNETGGFFDKTEFSAPNFSTDSIVNVQTPLQSPDLYLYSGQSFTTQ